MYFHSAAFYKSPHHAIYHSRLPLLSFPAPKTGYALGWVSQLNAGETGFVISYTEPPLAKNRVG